MSGEKANLAELMGARAQEHQKGELSMKDLPHIFGEKMPELPRNAVGRHRLINGLKQRFGPGFRNMPGIKNLLKEFDEDVEFEARVESVRRIKPKGGKRG